MESTGNFHLIILNWGCYIICRVSGGRGSAKHKGERREQKERTEGELQHLQYLVENLQSQLQEKDKQIYDLSHRYGTSKCVVQEM